QRARAQVREQDLSVADRRNPADAGLAPSEQPDSAGYLVVAHDADARHAHRRSAQGARRRERRGVRQGVPDADDPASQRRAEDGVGPLRDAARRAGRRRLGLCQRRADRADRRDRNDAADAREPVIPPRPLPELRLMATARWMRTLVATLVLAAPTLAAQTYP